MADKVLITELYPLIEKSLSKKENVDSLQKLISTYIDRNIEKLSTIGPTKLTLFIERDTQPVYQIIGATEEFVKGLKNKSKDIKKDGYTMKYPFNCLMPMVIRYFAIKNNKKMIEMCTMYLTLSIYPLLFTKYFKYEPNENVMNYTINNLTSRYKIKQKGNLLAALVETGQGAYDLLEKDIIRGTDKDIVDFVLSMRTRLNSFLKKISVSFYENVNTGKYMNLDIDDNDKDNYREADSSIQAIDRLINKTAMKLIVEGPSMKLIKIASRYSQVSNNELRNYLNIISVKTNKTDICSVLENILYDFIITEQNDFQSINSDKFLLTSLESYRSSSEGSKMSNIKKILDKWLDDVKLYEKTSRVATINNFRKAIYVFFVTTLQTANIN